MTITNENPFGLIKPITFAASMLTSSTAAATDPSAWSGATPYTAGQIVSIASTQLCYICLIANTGASPDVNLLGATPKWAVSTTQALAWNAATAYIVGGRCRLAATNRVYECLIANTNFSPDVNTTGALPKWLDLGATNEHACFDEKWGTQTLAISTLTMVITPGQVIDSIALLNMLGSSVTVTCAVGATTIYTRTVALETDVGVFDWKTYFIAPIVAEDDVVVIDLLPYALQTITITITGPGAVAIGSIAMGAYIELGVLQSSPTVGIISYDKKTTDDYGGIYVTQRGYAKRFSGKVIVENNFVDQLVAILAQVRSIPVVWMGAGSLYSSLIVWGFFKDFDVDIAYPTISYCTITIEGLV